MVRERRRYASDGVGVLLSTLAGSAMDPDRNPFAPAAGTAPPILAGREQLIIEAKIALARMRALQPSRSHVLLGPRGAGKTVLLHEIARVARVEAFRTVHIEARPNARLPDLLVAPLRRLLSGLANVLPARPATANAMSALNAFTGTFAPAAHRPRSGQRRPRRSRPGDLRAGLPELLVTASRAAQAAGSALAMFVDEHHFLSPECVDALVLAVQQADRRGVPLILFLAGLGPPAQADTEASVLAERHLVHVTVPPLTDDAAACAIAAPIRRAGGEIEPAAVAAIVRASGGHPFFLQCWGWHVWEAASPSPIGPDDVARAAPAVQAALDREFFSVGLDRLAPREREYLRAMAQLGPGPHRSGDIAALLHLPVTAVAHRRGVLIRKGVIFSPQRGETAFAAPGLDDYLRRVMPDWAPGGVRRPR